MWMDAKQFTPYIAAPSSVIQSYVGNSSSSAANATVPSVSELQALQSELHSIQQDLSDREQKLRADEERLRSFRPNAKGKPKEQYDKPATVPFGGTNGAQPAVDKKMLNRLKRAGSAESSSTDLSEPESIQSRPKKNANKKRKRGVVESDEEYSDVQTAPDKPNSINKAVDTIKSRKVQDSSSPAPLSNTQNQSQQSRQSSAPKHVNNLPAAPPKAASTNAQNPASAPSPVPSASSLPPALKFKINSGSQSSSSSNTKKDTPAQSPLVQRKSGLSSSISMEEFSLPSRPLVPPRPQSVVPTPLPKTQADVTDDFSQAKPGTQVPFSTFLGYVDPFLRNFGEDDLAYLAQKSEDLTPFLIPALGRHYAEVWAEEDSTGVTLGNSVGAHNSALELPQLERFRAEDITNDKLTNESLFMGPLSERLLAAIIGDGWNPAQPNADSEMDEIDLDLRFQSSRRSPSPPNDEGLSHANGDFPKISQTHQIAQNFRLDQTAPMDAVELEERIRRELRFLGVFPSDHGTSHHHAQQSGLLMSSANGISNAVNNSRARDGDIDWSSRTDDEISAALRACQRQLSEQIGTNEARKSRLAARVRDRLARQEFESLRDGLEKTIETGWLKRQRVGTSVRKKTAPSGATVEVSHAAPSRQRHVPLSDALCQAIDRRRKLLSGLKDVFAAEPGRYYGISYSPLDDVQEVDDSSAM